MNTEDRNSINENELDNVNGGTGSVGRKYNRGLEKLTQGIKETQKTVQNPTANALKGNSGKSSEVRTGTIKR